MGTLTTRLSLYKPDTDPAESSWGEEVNDNFDIIDAIVVELEDDIANLAPLVLSAVTVSASRDLALTDAAKVLEVNGNYTVTVPPNSEVAFPVGTVIQIMADTASDVTIVADGGVTLQSEYGLILNAQYAIATLRKRATDTWHVYGSLRSS